MAVVQVLPARSSGSSSCKTHGLCRLGRTARGEIIAYNHWLKQQHGVELIRALVENRLAYLTQMGFLLREIKVPKVLLWIGQRHWSDKADTYPSLVSDEMLSTLRQDCDEFVPVVSEQWTADGYPNAMMHHEIAYEVKRQLRRL